MSFKKFPEIERLGHEDNKEILAFNEDIIVIEEKVDGGNFSMWIDEDNSIHFGSRNRDLTSDKDTKIFSKFQVWLRNHINILQKENINLNPDYIYYLEVLQVHTLKYVNPPHFIGLDIRLRHSRIEDNYGLFISRDAKELEFQRLRIPTVPLIWRGTAKELKNMDINSLIGESRIENWKGDLIL